MYEVLPLNTIELYCHVLSLAHRTEHAIPPLSYYSHGHLLILTVDDVY